MGLLNIKCFIFEGFWNFAAENNPTSHLSIPHLQVERNRNELSDAKSTARQEDILAVCKLHGHLGTPTVQNQLQALGKEYQQLKEQGQSSKADYVQTLYIWLSKKTGKVTSSSITLDAAKQ